MSVLRQLSAELRDLVQRASPSVVGLHAGASWVRTT
jgi:hypothetical protein